MIRVVVGLVLVTVAACGPAPSAQPSPAAAASSASASPTPRPQAAVAVPVISESPAPPTPTPSPIPTIALKLEANWTGADRAADGFAIGLPPRWRAVDLDPAALEASLRTIDDPQYQNLLRTQTSSLVASGVKLFAFDFTPGNVTAAGFATNLNVIQQQLPYAVSLDLFEQLTVSQLEVLDAVTKPVAHQRVNLPAGAFEKLTYRLTLTTDSGRSTSAVTQYLTINGLTAYVLTFTTTPTQAASYSPMFAKIAATFALAK